MIWFTSLIKKVIFNWPLFAKSDVQTLNCMFKRAKIITIANILYGSLYLRQSALVCMNYSSNWVQEGLHSFGGYFWCLFSVGGHSWQSSGPIGQQSMKTVCFSLQGQVSCDLRLIDTDRRMKESNTQSHNQHFQKRISKRNILVMCGHYAVDNSTISHNKTWLKLTSIQLCVCYKLWSNNLFPV